MSMCCYRIDLEPLYYEARLLPRLPMLFTFGNIFSMRSVDPGRFQPCIYVKTWPNPYMCVVEELLWDKHMNLEVLVTSPMRYSVTNNFQKILRPSGNPLTWRYDFKGPRAMSAWEVSIGCIETGSNTLPCSRCNGRDKFFV